MKKANYRTFEKDRARRVRRQARLIIGLFCLSATAFLYFVLSQPKFVLRDNEALLRYDGSVNVAPGGHARP